MDDKNCLSDFHFRMLGKMIRSESNGEYYELPERYSPKLLDLGLISIETTSHSIPNGHVTCSAFCVTDSGYKAYLEQIKRRQQEITNEN